MTREEIRAELFRLRDGKYAELQKKLIPTADPDRFIGVRTPALRRFAGALYGDDGAEAFLRDLPHRYFDEDQLHAFVISREKDFDRCLAEVEAFLPHIDNWATCDQLSPEAFRREPERLIPHIRRWLGSEHAYTVRFGLGMLMQHFLDKRFKPEYAELAASLRSEEYYVNMMVAWYFATALAKQYDAVLPCLEERRLDPWTHNKAIRKCMESRRITEEQKRYLRTLKAGRPEGKAADGGAAIREERLSPEEYLEFLKRTDLGSQYPRERFAERIAKLVENAPISLVARDRENAVAGVLFGLTDYAYWLFVTDLGVARDWERRGLGTRLMKAAHTLAGGERDIAVYLVANENAVPFYEKLGMKRAGDVMQLNHIEWTEFTVE